MVEDVDVLHQWSACRLRLFDCCFSLAAICFCGRTKTFAAGCGAIYTDRIPNHSCKWEIDCISLQHSENNLLSCRTANRTQHQIFENSRVNRFAPTYTGTMALPRLLFHMPDVGFSVAGLPPRSSSSMQAIRLRSPWITRTKFSLLTPASWHRRLTSCCAAA